MQKDRKMDSIWPQNTHIRHLERLRHFNFQINNEKNQKKTKKKPNSSEINEYNPDILQIKAFLTKKNAKRPKNELKTPPNHSHPAL
jgi:uncharacterized protein (DUF1786 family)